MGLLPPFFLTEGLIALLGRLDLAADWRSRSQPPLDQLVYVRLSGAVSRHIHPGERIYTFWHYKRSRWQRDVGLRLDHLLLSPNVHDRLVDAGVDRDVRGREGASDHAPAWIRLL